MTREVVAVLLASPDLDRALGWPDAMLLAAALATCGVIVVVDARERIIPDPCNLSLALLGLAFAGRGGLEALSGAAAEGGAAFGIFWAFRALYHRLRGRHGLGLGDVKFLGAATLWTGLADLPPLVLAACAAALAWLGIARLRGRAVTAGLAMPFGPFLVVGFLAVLALRLG